MNETRPKRVREPLQVYLAEEERRLLDRLAREAGVSRAEILRRGIAAVARESEPWDASPVLSFVRRVGSQAGDLPPDVASRHDDYLADEARGTE
ncbi:MAG TPA: CopG family transcriptional regulator [Gemmatimonadales bacterium]